MPSSAQSCNSEVPDSLESKLFGPISTCSMGREGHIDLKDMLWEMPTLHISITNYRMQSSGMTTSIERQSLTLPTLQKLDATVPDDVDAESIAVAWFTQFSQGLETADIPAVVSLLLDDAFWRDMLALTWEFRTFIGTDRISQFLMDIIKSPHTDPGSTNAISKLSLDERNVVLQAPYPDLVWIQGMFSFETPVGLGSGIFRLVPTSSGVWKAHVVYTNLEEIKGHPEKIGELRNMDPIHGDEWQKERYREINFIDSEPAVVVIGGGQAGLEIAARLKYLDVPSLVIERHPRIGDSWRKRYDALSLHDPIYTIHMPYVPFPPTWPLWTPSSKFADWLESYASILDLNVWTSTSVDKLERAPVPGQGHWIVHITKSDGQKRIMNPRHVIFAHGIYGGAPNIPVIPGMDSYKGKIIHSSQHTRAKENEGKKVVVIGACTSGHDIAQDHARNGIDVTMIQRGSTYVMSIKHGVLSLQKPGYWENTPSPDVSDRIGASFPYPLVKLMHQRLAKRIADLDKDLLDGLKSRGFRTNQGEDGSGVIMLFVNRAGGYYFDNGAAQLIIDGKIKLKNDSSIKQFKEYGIEFEDGSYLPADVVILTTGYHDALDTVHELAGESIVEAVKPLWGLNDEGEINSLWRYSGVPGLYFMMGNLALCRFHSKHLALQIKAHEVGVHGKRYTVGLQPKSGLARDVKWGKSE